MKKYTPSQLSGLAGISVRTLHYYDEIGLLKPQGRSESGYRHYGEAELLKLQQILFFRELEVPLEKIESILNSPHFNLVEALKSHRQQMVERSKRFKVLIRTIDNTLDKLNHKTMLTDDQLYQGFSSVEEGKKLSEEAAQKWGADRVKESHEKVRKMSPAQWKQVQDEGREITLLLASLMHLEPSHPDVQKAIARHYQHLFHFYTPNKEMYRGLGQMYVQDSRFTAFYDKVAKGLAQFICDAIEVFCGN